MYVKMNRLSLLYLYSCIPQANARNIPTLLITASYKMTYFDKKIDLNATLNKQMSCTEVRTRILSGVL